MNDINNFIKIDDNIIENILKFNDCKNNLLKKSSLLYERIKNRQLYKFVKIINKSDNMTNKFISLKKRRNPHLIFNEVNLNSMKKYLDNVNYYNSNLDYLNVQNNELNFIQVFDKIN